jgi:hypothetical protein
LPGFSCCSLSIFWKKGLLLKLIYFEHVKQLIFIENTKQCSQHWCEEGKNKSSLEQAHSGLGLKGSDIRLT